MKIAAHDDDDDVVEISIKYSIIFMASKSLNLNQIPMKFSNSNWTLRPSKKKLNFTIFRETNFKASCISQINDFFREINFQTS